MQKLTRNQKIIIGVVAGVALFLTLVFLGVIPGLRPAVKKGTQATLEFWGVYDTDDAYRLVINQFQNLHSGIQIKYRQYNPENYESELINALAAGKGPDIFMIHNTWLPKHYDKIVTLPKEKLSLTTYTDQLFPEVVEKDFTANQSIYAIPLSVDTLALIYNKDIFNQSGVALIPSTWGEFANVIPRLKILDNTGRIKRAGAAIGGSGKSIDQAADLLSLLMIQFGAQMTSADFSRATFAQATASGIAPGLDALNFYTIFSNPVNYDYTWDDTLGQSLDSFAESSVAMIFDYAYRLPYIKTKNPFLNFSVASVPQTDTLTPVNYANYWGYTVSSKSAYSNAAWDFILLLTTNQDNAQSYIDKTQKPPALRFLIQKYLSDPNLGVFAKQALTAKSWPQIDNSQVKTIFSNMIESVISGKQTAATALGQAEAQITQLMSARK